MNMKFNNSFPWLMACIAAFIITLLIRLMLPTTENVQYSANNLRMPDIPFLEKDAKKNRDSYVLVALKDIKQYEKITSQTVTWKKWPKEGISASFIAKDADGNMLNSSYTYSNVINLFAKFPIVKGTPVTMTMLSRKRQEGDEAKKLAAMKRSLRKKIEKEVNQKISKEFEQKLKDETDAIRKNDIMISKDKVKSGMGVVTVPIDQRSIASNGFLNIGDRVDLLYPSKSNNKQNFIKFKNVKILEIDGKRDISAIDKIQNAIPRNITVEIENAFIEALLKQVTDGHQAIILVKNQHDVVREEIASNPIEKLLEERKKNNYINEFMKHTVLATSENKPQNTLPPKKEDNRILKFAINTFNSVNKQNTPEENTYDKRQQKLLELAKSSFNNEQQKRTEHNKLFQTMNAAFENDALVNEDASDTDTESDGVITISRKNKSDIVQYDKNGKIIDTNASADLGPSSNQPIPNNVQISKGGSTK